ncbi:hypothetical protein CDD83_2819 [Cordyceps sp. RAO-2017]|nr:hypothetical protein CDD83_2819 [Cordyceps sp. RAO-2017]
MLATAEAQAATLERFIQGWSGWTPDGFLATWSEDCTQKQLPYRYGVPLRRRKDVEHLFPILMSLMTNFELTVHNIVHDTAHGKAVIYAATKADTPFGPYENEHSLFVWFDETGGKVQKIEEMFDTLVMQEFQPQIENYLAQLKAQA